MNIANLLFGFGGRINRAKFWLGYLLATAISVLLLGVAAALIPWDQVMTLGPEGAPVLDELGNPKMDFSKIGAAPMALYFASIALSLVMSFALMVKRCHDRGYSGWMSLIALIPLAGFIWVIIALGVMEGEPGPNKWGPNPLAGRA